jgi:hypothetical protein
MRRYSLIGLVMLLPLIGCNEPPQQQSWNCLQSAQINSDMTATQNSLVEYSTPKSAKSSGTVVIENAKLKKSSVLKTELTFSRSDSGKKIKMTLLSADLTVVKDELDLLSDGRARALLPDIGSSISGEVIYEQGKVQRVKYENGEILECILLDD